MKLTPRVPEKTSEYTITDPAAREMAAQRIAIGQKTIWLRPSEARFYLANGGVVPMAAPQTPEPQP